MPQHAPSFVVSLIADYRMKQYTSMKRKLKSKKPKTPFILLITNDLPHGKKTIAGQQ